MPPEAAPQLRLPTDTRPTGEQLVLDIDPQQDRFSGAVDITVTLDHARRVVWLHGKGLHVSHATITSGTLTQPATWAQADASGIASLTVEREVPAGTAKLHVEFDAAWGPKLEGLHKVVSAGVPYAFTQFESVAARDAFPCFDEPGFKIPWDETLVVPADVQAIANTHETGRTKEANAQRVTFATTLPLPSYLVAFAVGPFDVVAAPDIPPNAVRTRVVPLRAITAKGRGKEIAYALAHTGEILATLEQYVGLEYPYDKLDIISVPDKGGAMENPGAVTFADFLLLFDEKTASIRQRRAYAGVMAHELAHMWTGDLVTAAWWNDIWLNEAFATFLGTKAMDAWDPKSDGATSLLESIMGAISVDGQVSARSIRQPIESTNDIENAFDSITYRKGGGVLKMFEHWLGPDVFQRGLHEYLSAHRFANATADDFLAAESKASGKDVATPFHTFLDQPGVPFIEAEVKCDATPHMHVKQSRYLPLGSSGDSNKTWQVPICVRYGNGKESKETCTLLAQPEGDLPLGAKCPDWVFPNSAADGYYRFSLAESDLDKLRKRGLAQLTAHERVAFENSVSAGYNRGTISMRAAFDAAAPLALDPHPSVATYPMGFIDQARDWLFADPLRAHVEARARSLFHAQYAKLGWDPKKDDDADRLQLRAQVISFLAFEGHDPQVRAEAKKRGLAYLGYQKDGAIHKDAVDTNLVGVALGVLGQDADVALWESIRAQLGKTEDADLRGKLLGALTRARAPELVTRARELVFDPSLRATEVTAPLWGQLDDPARRDALWPWIEAHYDQIVDVMPKHHGLTQIIDMAGSFCDDAHEKEVTAFFTPARIARIDGAPRVLAATIERIHLCTAKRAKQEPSARELFGKK